LNRQDAKIAKQDQATIEPPRRQGRQEKRQYSNCKNAEGVHQSSEKKASILHPGRTSLSGLMIDSAFLGGLGVLAVNPNLV
jgi:hypothetical protein